MRCPLEEGGDRFDPSGKSGKVFAAPVEDALERFDMLGVFWGKVAEGEEFGPDCIRDPGAMFIEIKSQESEVLFEECTLSELEPQVDCRTTPEDDLEFLEHGEFRCGGGGEIINNDKSVVKITKDEIRCELGVTRAGFMALGCNIICKATAPGRDHDTFLEEILVKRQLEEKVAEVKLAFDGLRTDRMKNMVEVTDNLGSRHHIPIQSSEITDEAIGGAGVSVVCLFNKESRACITRKMVEISEFGQNFFCTEAGHSRTHGFFRCRTRDERIRP